MKYLSEEKGALQRVSEIDFMDVMNKDRFQKLIYPAGITYKRKGSLGTASCGYLVSLLSDFETDKSLVVGDKGLEPLTFSV